MVRSEEQVTAGEKQKMSKRRSEDELYLLGRMKEERKKETFELTHHLSLLIKLHIHHRLRMALHRPLQLPTLPIPYLNARILARCSQNRVERVEGNLGDG